MRRLFALFSFVVLAGVAAPAQAALITAASGPLNLEFDAYISDVGSVDQIGATAKHADSPQLQGMIRAVEHLVEVDGKDA